MGARRCAHASTVVAWSIPDVVGGTTGTHGGKFVPEDAMEVGLDAELVV